MTSKTDQRVERVLQQILPLFRDSSLVKEEDLRRMLKETKVWFATDYVLIYTPIWSALRPGGALAEMQAEEKEFLKAKLELIKYPFATEQAEMERAIEAQQAISGAGDLD